MMRVNVYTDVFIRFLFGVGDGYQCDVVVEDGEDGGR